MDPRKLAIIAILSALTVVIAYSRGLGLPTLPGLVEFMTILIFVSGFQFGVIVGGSVGFISLVIYTLIPFPFGIRPHGCSQSRLSFSS